MLKTARQGTTCSNEIRKRKIGYTHTHTHTQDTRTNRTKAKFLCRYWTMKIVATTVSSCKVILSCKGHWVFNMSHSGALNRTIRKHGSCPHTDLRMCAGLNGNIPVLMFLRPSSVMAKNSFRKSKLRWKLFLKAIYRLYIRSPAGYSFLHL